LKYRVSRAETFRAQQELFEKHEVTSRYIKDKALRAVTWMLLSVNISLLCDFKMNKQLMFVESGVIYPITPLVKNLLDSYWGMDQEADLEAVFSSNDWTNEVKARAIKKYIIRQIEKEKCVTLNVQKLTAPNTWLPQQFTFQNLTSIHFEDIKRPPGSVDWTNPILFVPESSKNFDVDMLLWDPAQQLLLLVQINRHTNGIFTGENWKLQINKPVCVEFLTVGTTFSNQFTQYVCLLSDLDQSKFPLLQRSKIQ
jgi:hypothetical protein